MLLEVALVVVLGVIERRGGDDLGDDRPGQDLLVLITGGDRQSLLLGVVNEDRRPVLTAEIPPLPVTGRRVVNRPERPQQLVVGDDRRVKPDVNRLGMTEQTCSYVGSAVSPPV